jgi:hypothetical protein
VDEGKAKVSGKVSGAVIGSYLVKSYFTDIMVPILIKGWLNSICFYSSYFLLSASSSFFILCSLTILAMS